MPINRKAFYASIRTSLFDGSMTASQVNGMGAILDEWERRKLTDLRWLAYMLATVYHECAKTMVPIVEYGGLRYLVKKKYYPWYGRGFVQLTWDYNYRKFAGLLKDAGFVQWDLIANPDLALDLKVASFIMFEGMIRGLFRKNQKLSDFFNANDNNPVMARGIINGIPKGQTLPDKAVEIAEIHAKFNTALAAAA